MFEMVKCLREKSSPTASMSVETTKPEEVKKTMNNNCETFTNNHQSGIFVLLISK